MPKCEECKDKGYYTVYNAWNPDYSKIVRCEYCDGVPKVKTSNVREKVSDEGTGSLVS